MLEKIVVVGPESTGKSTLCLELAEHYHTVWCPEYAREYLTVHGLNYQYQDLLSIAKGQVALEEKYITGMTRPASPAEKDSQNAPSLLFIDTNMYVMKVWCEFVFGKCHPFILEQLASRKYDLYLLCNTDLEWKQDVLREYPDLETRQKLFEIYKRLLENQGTPWVEIKGNGRERLEIAVETVDRLLLH